MLDRVAEEIAHGRNPEALRLALENSHEQIQKLDHDPSLQAELFKRVGLLYDTIGERKHTLPLLKGQVEVLGKIHGRDSQEAWDAELAYLVKVVDHGARSSAPPLLEDLLRRLEGNGQDHSNFWFLVKRQLVRAWTKLRQPKEATDAAKQTLQELAKHQAPVSTTISVKAACHDAFKEAGDFAMAESLIISLPQAITPVVWRMELGHARSSALEVRKADNGHFVLTLKTPKGDVYDIAPFDQRGRAVEALMAVSRAMEQAHGQIRPVAANAAGVTNLPAVRAEKRPASKSRVITGLVGTGLLFVLVAILMSTGNPNKDGDVTILPGATSAANTPAAGQATGNAEQAGIPQSADDFLNNR